MKDIETLDGFVKVLAGGAQIGQIAPWLADLIFKYGYLGVFFISLLGSLSIVFPLPYTLTVFMLGLFLDPKLLALSAGAGSALGETLGYFIGYYGGYLISEERKRKMKPIVKIFERYGAIAVFIFALTPLPDDLLMIPLGVMRIPFIKVFLPCLAGKIIMCLALAYGGKAMRGLLTEFIGGEHNIIVPIITLVLLIVIIVTMLKVNWEQIFKRDHS